MHARELAFVRFATRAAVAGSAGGRIADDAAGLDWSAVVTLATRHRVSGAVSDAVRALAPGLVPDRSKRQLEADAFAGLASTLSAVSEMAAAVDVLRDRAVPVAAAPSARFELAAAGVRAAGLRRVRLVVDNGDVLRARRALLSAGYRVDPPGESNPTAFVARFDGRPPVGVYAYLEPRFGGGRPQASAIGRAVDVRLADRVLPALPPDARLVALSVAAAAREWARLDHLAAVAALARGIGDWRTVVDRPDTRDLRRMVLASMLLAEDVLRLDLGVDAGRDPVSRRIAATFRSRFVTGTEPPPIRAALLQIAARQGAVARARSAGRQAIAMLRERLRRTPAVSDPAPRSDSARRSSRRNGLRPEKLILRQGQSPGDLVMLSAAIRELHLHYPGRFVTDVRTPAGDLWAHNPYITPIADDDPEARTIACEYPLIHQSNQRPVHFLHGFIEFLNDRLDLRMHPSAFKGDIWLSDAERQRPSPAAELGNHDGPYWLVSAGGKFDFTIKWWSAARYQEVVDHFRGRITFVQIGESGHHHPALGGVVDLRGRTSLRDLIRLVYWSDGVLGPVSLPMHLAAAVETPPGRPPMRPCVVIAGGREPVQWEAYPGHQYLHTIGALPCCATGGCWRSRTLPIGDGDPKDEPAQLCVDVVGDLPRCMDAISASDVIRSIERYQPDRGPVAINHAGDRARAAIPAPRDRIIERADPSVGLVIGTFAAVPYVHLALESRRRHFSGVPVLVHDDGSPMTHALRQLCREYEVEFSTNPTRTARTVGDMSSYVYGLEWAHERGLDLLVKMSRRFVTLANWVPGLQRLAHETQYATYSQRCLHFDFGFRTECVAFHVETWRHHRAMAAMRGRVDRNEPAFVEGFLHDLARDVHRTSCRVNRELERRRPRPRGAEAYGAWNLMADRRTTRQADVLWHDANDADDYWRVAASYGLPYTRQDFVDPNQGFGVES